MMRSLSVVTALLLTKVAMGFGPLADSFQVRVIKSKLLQTAREVANTNNDDDDFAPAVLFQEPSYDRRSMLLRTSAAVVTAVVANVVLVPPTAVSARLESVNRPDLLPTETGQYVIQTEKFLTSGQARRMNDMLKALERDTGFRVRVLCQNYPNTPGLAIRDYWDLGKEGQKDDKYVVLVVDQFGGRGNVLNFNVGDGLKFALPNVFWTRLSGKYGTTFYVKENGVDLAAINAIEAIVSCLRNEDGYCTSPPEQGQSLKTLGF